MSDVMPEHKDCTDDGPVSACHPELFHYTTVDAFASIYQTRTFWATHYEDMNDSSELQMFQTKLGESIRPVIQKIAVAKGLDGAWGEREVARWLNIFHQTALGEHGLRDTFICSFCTHDTEPDAAKHGLLSQWRGYGANGGVAIVLNTRGIEDLMECERNTFVHPVNHIGNVIYDNEDDKIREKYGLVFDCAREIINTIHSNNTLDPSLDKILVPFIQATTLIKHHGFREEQEVRIVVSPRPADTKSIFYEPADATKQTKSMHYRKKDDNEVRYISLFGSAPLPIQRVIVGPSKFQNFNFQKVVELVKGSIDTEKSNIPFIG